MFSQQFLPGFPEPKFADRPLKRLFFGYFSQRRRRKIFMINHVINFFVWQMVFFRNPLAGFLVAAFGRNTVIVNNNQFNFGFHSFFTVALLASTSIISPSFKTLVAILVPMTHGFLSSRETIAACEVIPPRSVTIAAASFMAGTRSGLVIWETKMSPFLLFFKSLIVLIILTRPRALPKLAA